MVNGKMIEKINLLLRIFYEKEKFDIGIHRDKIRFSYIVFPFRWKSFYLKIKSSIKKINIICVNKDKSFIEIFTYSK